MGRAYEGGQLSRNAFVSDSCDVALQEEAEWLEAQGCGEGLAALTADGMALEFLQMRMLHFSLPAG